MENGTRKKFIGDYLIEAGIINAQQLGEALEYQRKNLKKGDVGLLGQTLVEMGYCKSEDIMLALAMRDGVPFMVLDTHMIDEKAVGSIPRDIMLRYKAVPIGFENEKLLVAMMHPTDIISIDDLRILTGYDIQPIIIPDFQLQYALDEARSGAWGKTSLENLKKGHIDLTPKDMGDTSSHGTIQPIEGDVEVIEESTDERPAVQLANMIFNQAVRGGASDVHIEPFEKNTRIRFRIDGVLHETMSSPKPLHPSLVSRIKVMANMDIAERRVPQDGRVTLRIDSKTIDIRIASFPTAYGEKLTLRLLSRDDSLLTLAELGFPENQLDTLHRIMNLPYGFILVVGPTGSGKSTTLYAMLNKLNSIDKNIITIEDPIERRIDGINQSQVNVKAGMTFASALRSFLRNDPDIMMVGEIRDYETAKISVESALTGHLVLSTLHTNNAAGAITRLDDMGIEPFLTASSLIGVIAQRLVRVLCPDCKESYEISREELLKNFFDFPLKKGEENINLYRAKSCYKCNHTGYRGRIGIYEILPITETIRKLILGSQSDHIIMESAIKEGMLTFRHHGLSRVRDGITSIEELLRVVV